MEKPKSETPQQRYARKNKAKRRASNRKSYLKNKAKYQARWKVWAEKNKEHIAAYKKEYRKKNREHMNQVNNTWRANNPEKIKQHRANYFEKLKSDPERLAKYHKGRNEYAKKHLPTRVRRALHARITRLLKFAKTNKACGTTELLGCTIQKLKAHIEAQFDDTMTWDNWGRDGWHIDHIKPCKDFDLTKRSEQLACFNYTNLRPLWYTDNLARRFE